MRIDRGVAGLLVGVAIAAMGLGACGSAGRVPVTSPATIAESGDLLIAAAQRQEMATVRELLARGADVDAKTRYGATALFFACDKGNLELVKLLLEHGAEVDVTDTFYSATPLTWSLFSAAESAVHREIALLLLERGPADADEAVLFGARQGDLELVEAAVDNGGIEPAALLAPLEQAREAGHQEIVDYLSARAPEEAPARDVSVSPERLVEVEWGADGEESYPVDILVTAYDRHGLLRDITSVLADAKINVIAVNLATDKKEHLSHMTLTVEVTNIHKISQALSRIGQLPNVIEARRRMQ